MNNQTLPAEITYNGELSSSDKSKSIITTIQVSYNKNKANVSFLMDNELISFTAVQSENGIRVQEKVMDDYILSGINVIDDPSMAPVRVGKGRQAFSFYIIVDFFTGENREIKFRGNVGAYVKPKSSKKKGVFKSLMAAMF